MGRTKRRRLRKVTRNVDEESHDKILGLLRWMRLKNSHFKIVDYDDSGRGVFSRTNICAGDELIAVPLDCMITMKDVKCSDIFDFLTNFLDTPQVALAVFLLYEKHLGAVSEYFNYINILPNTYDTLLYCNDLELNKLPPWIEGPAKDCIVEVKEYYNNIQCISCDKCCKHCDSKLKTIITYDSLLWAWSTINTRGVYFENEDILNKSAGTLALAPFLDLFNHSNEADVEVQLDCQRGVYALKTNRPYKKYDQIFIKYGAHSNLRLLLEYGFILNDLTQDVIEFTFEEVVTGVRSISTRLGEVTKLKYKFIKSNNLNVNLTKDRDEFSWNFNGLLYILVTQDSDLVQLLSKTYSSAWSQKEEHVMNEVKAFVLRQKSIELSKQLQVMTGLKESSFAFREATDLVRNYIKIIEA